MVNVRLCAHHVLAVHIRPPHRLPVRWWLFSPTLYRCERWWRSDRYSCSSDRQRWTVSQVSTPQPCLTALCRNQSWSGLAGYHPATADCLVRWPSGLGGPTAWKDVVRSAQGAREGVRLCVLGPRPSLSGLRHSSSIPGTGSHQKCLWTPVANWEAAMTSAGIRPQPRGNSALCLPCTAEASNKAS